MCIYYSGSERPDKNTQIEENGNYSNNERIRSISRCYAGWS